MKTLLIAALALLALPAHAAVIGLVAAQNGAAIELHDEPGPTCVGDALRAEWVPLQGPKVGGCWVQGGGFVLVLFFDGDISRVPSAAIKAPVRL